MPERRIFKGREIKNAVRLSRPDGGRNIKITFVSCVKGTPGEQLIVTADEYAAHVVKQFVSNQASVAGS